MRLRNVLVGSAIAASLNAAVYAAAPIIVVGNSNLLPNQAGQQLQLLISGSDQVVGTDLYMELDPLAGGAPSITGLNLLTGTIFSTNNTGAKGTTIGTGTLSNFAAVSTTTNSGSVADSGLLVTLTINTTGLTAGGVIHLNLSTTYNGVPSDLIASATSGPLTLLTPTYLSNLISIGTAAVREWNVNHSGTWGTDNNWTPFAPYAYGDQANFFDAVQSGIVANVTLDGDRTAGSITFNNTVGGSYVISQGLENGSIHLNGASPAITDLAGNHTISAPVILSAASAIGVSSSSILTMSGVISGSQNVSITGPGTLVLTAANSLGNATISGGATVVLAGQGSMGSGITANINNSGVVFNRTDSSVVDTTCIGNGSLTQAGTGTTSLTGVNTYGGPTLISAGTLIVGNNGTTGALGTGNVTNNSTLAFNRSSSLSVTAAISGTGSIIKQATGTTVLNGNGYTATGPVSVSAGTLGFTETTNVRHSPAILLRPSSVSVTSNGSALDISNHDLLIPGAGTAGAAATQYSTIKTLVNNGMENYFGLGIGNPSGPQITSSSVYNNPNFSTVIVAFSLDAYFGDGSYGSGEPLQDPNYTDNINVTQPGSIMVKYGYYGDLDFDGTVDPTDLQIVLTDMAVGLTTPGKADLGVSYLNGDLEGDGFVSTTDLQLELSALALYGAGGPQNTGPLGSLDGSVTPAISLGGSSPVPEPASLAAAVSMGVTLFLRRTKRR